MSREEAAKQLYRQCRDMNIEETMNLILQADSEEEQDFFSMLGDFILQQQQKNVIAEKRF